MCSFVGKDPVDGEACQRVAINHPMLSHAKRNPFQSNRKKLVATRKETACREDASVIVESLTSDELKKILSNNSIVQE